MPDDQPNRPILAQIDRAMDRLRPSERKVAVQVLAAPDQVIARSIAALAAAAGVSEPTVLRFCRALGCDGFQDFKLRLAQSLAGGLPLVLRGIEPDDDVPMLARKISGQAAAAIAGLADAVDWAPAAAAVAALAAARRIELHGAGASGIVALDARHKLFRLDLAVSASCDPHDQVMAAAGLGPRDVLVSFSYTGRAREVVEAARIAAGRGAVVVAVTAVGSPLAALAHHSIGLPVIEDTELYSPMVSRLLQLVVVDVLEVGVALHRGRDLADHLRRVKEALALARLSPPVAPTAAAMEES